VSRLVDRVFIVTGAARGLGLSCARRLASEGAHVILADADDPGPQAQEFIGRQGNALFVRTDISKPRDVDALVARATGRFGRINGLVNNAAIFTSLPRRPFEELTPDDWLAVLSVNVIGTFNCIKAATPLMKAQGGGVIINVASNVVHKGLPLLLHYVASKGAVVAMTRSLARELGPFGIRVNAVAPGYMLHESTASTDQGRNEIVKSLRSLPRTETPEDVAGAVVFLASSDSDFVTGQTLVVDGGEVFA
jgi:NAD(P)-dependent dehydrogenase (short-subunit alcohol dehydrogenase family)